MSVKLIAMGNILMKDDGIGIEVAKEIEEALIQKGIEVIYGETDFQYCIIKVRENDFVLVLDGAFLGEKPGTVTVMPLSRFGSNNKFYTQHSYSFLDLIQIYYPSVNGKIFAIQIKEITYDFGLSDLLQENLKDIAKDVLSKIEIVLQERKSDYFNDFK